MRYHYATRPICLERIPYFQPYNGASLEDVGSRVYWFEDLSDSPDLRMPRQCVLASAVGGSVSSIASRSGQLFSSCAYSQ
jgi:hypothetical protein